MKTNTIRPAAVSLSVAPVAHIYLQELRSAFAAVTVSACDRLKNESKSLVFNALLLL
jgi:hypothetical protein